MLDRIRHLGGIRNGEFLTTTAVTAYVGGSPARATTDNTTVSVCVSDPVTGATGGSGYIGVFANSKALDQRNTSLLEYGVLSGGTSAMTFSTTGNYKATIITGPALMRFKSGTKDGYADGFPYETGDTWVAGDPLFVSTAGTWTNTQPGSLVGTANTLTLGQPRGRVITVGTDYLEVELYG